MWGIFVAGRYGAFSLGESQLGALIRYIDNQEEHHRSRDFSEELLDLLCKYLDLLCKYLDLLCKYLDLLCKYLDLLCKYKYRVAYDERVLWD